MNKTFAFLLLFIYVVGHTQPKSVKPVVRKFYLPSGIQKKDYLPNTIIVKYKNVISSYRTSANPKSIFKLKSAAITNVVKKFPSINARFNVSSEQEPNGLKD